MHTFHELFEASSSIPDKKPIELPVAISSTTGSNQVALSVSNHVAVTLPKVKKEPKWRLILVSPLFTAKLPPNQFGHHGRADAGLSTRDGMTEGE